MMSSHSTYHKTNITHSIVFTFQATLYLSNEQSSCSCERVYSFVVCDNISACQDCVDMDEYRPPPVDPPELLDERPLPLKKYDTVPFLLSDRRIIHKVV